MICVVISSLKRNVPAENMKQNNAFLLKNQETLSERTMQHSSLIPVVLLSIRVDT